MTNLILIIALFLPIAAQAGGSCSTEEFLAKVCLSDQPQVLDGSEVGKIKCESATPVIAEQLKAAFERSPEWLQNQFCALDGVGVYPTMPGSRTYSWSYPSLKFIGVSRIYLDQGYALSDHEKVMRKQSINKKTLSGEFPQAFGFSHTGDDRGLGVLYLMTHEIGHVLYGAKQKFGGPFPYDDCTIFAGQRACNDFKPYQFGYSSWVSARGPITGIVYGNPREENSALHSFVLAENTSQVSVADVDGFFRGVMNSAFFSAFGVFSPEEDFCEALATRVVAGNLETWSFKFLDGSVADYRAHVLAPTHAGAQTKLKFISDRGLQ